MRDCIAFPSVTIAPSISGGAAPVGREIRARGRSAVCPPTGRNLRQWVTVAAAVAALLVAERAAAQDWFVLLGAGPDRSSRTELEDRRCLVASPAASDHCQTANDALAFHPLADATIEPAVAFGIETALAPDLSVELFAEYGAGFALEGRAKFHAGAGGESGSALMSSLSELLAPYVDLPALGRYEPGSFSPFVGGGLGAVRMRTGETRMSFPKIGTPVPGESRVGRAWTVTAGVEVAVSSRSRLQLSWRYVDLFSVGTGPGSGRVEWREHGPAMPLPTAPTSAELRSHGIRLSLHYGF